MIRRILALAAFVFALCTPRPGLVARGSDLATGATEIPAAFAPLEYLVGNWKGQAMPKESGAQQFRGWEEKHGWAWIFSKGKPAGLSFTIDGGKIVASGKLTFDPVKKLYRLEGKEPGASAKAITFEGKFDSTGKQLVLERIAKEADSSATAGQMRLSLRPNANYLRYTMTQDRKAAGAAVFAKTIEVGVGKEGESFAGGSAATERPKCIVTGGLATLSVTFEGSTFPLCCSGCRDEFNDNPQKYVKKAALLLAKEAGKPKSAGAIPKKRGRDDAFADDVDESSQAPRPTAAKAKKKDSPAAGKMAKSDSDEGEPKDPAKSKDKENTLKDAPRTPAAKAAARAATILRMGRALERDGKTDQALHNYRQIVKDFADSPSAKTAKDRIKALEEK